jgi:signal transduction histidine kinase
MEAFDLLAGLTARLASTARLDEIVEAVVHDLAGLGFAEVWLAVLDERTGTLSTLKEMFGGIARTDASRKISTLDPRQPLGRGFRERRLINVTDPGSLHILERDEDPVPPDQLALPRAVYDRMRGIPFACGPLLGSRGEPVGALGLASYHGTQPIPDGVLLHGLVPAFADHLGIAMERALRMARLHDNLSKAQAKIANDAQINAVGELAAAVAHDLNNLSGIALLAVSIGSRSPADAFNVLPRIERANRAIGDLVARLQRISRPRSGEHEIADLHQIIDDILIMMRPVLREQAIEIDAELGAAPLVRCDDVLIHQVVMNLLINAHDALGAIAPDRRRIQLRVRDAGATVRLVVSDNGPGIAPEMLSRLFQPFVTTKGKGHLGLGLAAANAALKQFGGQIHAHNAPQGGAVFEVELVAAPVETEPSAPPPAAKVAAPLGAVRAKILAVDDDLDLVDFIHTCLETFGYDVVTATGSAEALDAVRGQSFDLVLCDIGMPGVSGLDMPRALRERGHRGKLVLMTGWEIHALSTDPRFGECDTHLKKPFGGNELIEVVTSVLAS